MCGYEIKDLLMVVYKMSMCESDTLAERLTDKFMQILSVVS